MNKLETAAEIPVSLRDFAERAKKRLSLKIPANLEAPASLEELTEQQGDHQVAKNMADILADKPFRPAAVLMPIVAHDAPTFLLTRRASSFASIRARSSTPSKCRSIS